MHHLAFLQNIGASELIIILLILLLLFGASKIPQMMKGFGEGIREFKKGMKEGEEGKEEEKKAPPNDTNAKAGASGGNGHPA
jgi:sec-independent protein translocase protein TatA